jgi:hypothetical protein
LNSPHRETPKNVIKKNSRKNRFWIVGRMFCKNFSTRFVCKKVFFCVFELPSLKNTRKRDKTKKSRKNWHRNFCRNVWFCFRHGLFVKTFLWHIIYGVFELPLPRNAQKRTKNKIKKKKVGWWVGLRFSKCTGGPVVCFCRPLARTAKGRSPAGSGSECYHWWCQGAIVLLGVGCVMKKWSTTHRQPIGVPCCQRSPTTPDVVTKKTRRICCLWALSQQHRKKLGQVLRISACSGQYFGFWPGWSPGCSGAWLLAQVQVLVLENRKARTPRTRSKEYL